MNHLAEFFYFTVGIGIGVGLADAYAGAKSTLYGLIWALILSVIFWPMILGYLVAVKLARQ